MIRRGTKTVFGLGMLGLGAWTMLNTYDASEGASAVVNGKVAIIRAPKDGYVSFGSLHRGSPIVQGKSFGTLALSVSPAQDFSGPQAVVQAKGRAQAVSDEIGGLQAQLAELRRQATEYRDARVKELGLKLSEAMASVDAARAKEHSTAAILDRQKREFALGFANKETVAAAEQAASAAQFDRTAAEKKVEMLKIETGAAKDGTYLGDGYNNSSYSQQRADQVSLRITELKAELQQQNAVAAMLSSGNPATAESGSKKGAAAVDSDIVSPVSGLLWSLSANSGQFVRAGDELARVIDCSQLFASMVVSQRSYGVVREGDRASFQGEGQAGSWPGTVVWAGVADREFGTRIQAALDPPTPADARYNLLVALNSAAAPGNSCPVGKPGRVTFETKNSWNKDASAALVGLRRRIESRLRAN